MSAALKSVSNILFFKDRFFQIMFQQVLSLISYGQRLSSNNREELKSESIYLFCFLWATGAISVICNINFLLVTICFEAGFSDVWTLQHEILIDQFGIDQL